MSIAFSLSFPLSLTHLTPMHKLRVNTHTRTKHSHARTHKCTRSHIQTKTHECIYIHTRTHSLLHTPRVAYFRFSVRQQNSARKPTELSEYIVCSRRNQRMLALRSMGQPLLAPTHSALLSTIATENPTPRPHKNHLPK